MNDTHDMLCACPDCLKVKGGMDSISKGNSAHGRRAGMKPLKNLATLLMLIPTLFVISLVDFVDWLRHNHR